MRRVPDNPDARFPDRPVAAAELPWFVAHVKARQEKALADDCRRLNVEYYLPLVHQVTRRRDNNKPRKSVLPLFPGYLSFTGAAETPTSLFATGRVAGIIEVRNQKKFVEELGQIQGLLGQGVSLEPCHIPFVQGEEVTIVGGPLRGVSGIIAHIRDHDRLIISVECMGRAMAAVDARLVKPLAPCSGNGKEKTSP